MNRLGEVVIVALCVGCVGGETTPADVQDAGAPDVLHPSHPVEGDAGAGGPCQTDDDCVHETLICSSLVPGGVCIAACDPKETVAEEEAQCGGVGTTCLHPGPERPAFCTRACEPAALTKDEASGGCRPGFVCTGWTVAWQGVPDDPGCSRFCSADEHCLAHESCFTRTGDCVPGAMVDLELTADGLPCVPSEESPGPTSPSSQCRGVCFGFTPQEGLCASLVDRAATAECPDDPDLIEPLGQANQDNVGVCIFRKCTMDSECTAPLRCLFRQLAATTVCTWPNPGE